MDFFKKIYPWLLFIFLGTFAWGTSFFWIKIGLQELTPFEVVAWRLSFGSLALWIVAIFKKLDVRLNKNLFFITCILSLLLMVLPITLITWAEKYIPSSVAGLLNALTPLFTIALSIFLVRSKQEISKQKFVGISIGFLGIFLIFLSDLSIDALTNDITPQLAVVLASGLYALGTLYGRAKLSGSNPLILSLYSLTWGALMLWGMVISLGIKITIPTMGSTWLALSWLGVICSSVATIVYLTLTRILGTTITSSVAYLFPLTAYFLGVLMLGEEFSLRELAGGLTIFAGIYIANCKQRFFQWHCKKTSMEPINKKVI